MKIKIKEDMRFEGKHVKANTEVEMNDQEARYFIGMGRAVALDQNPSPAEEEDAPASKDSKKSK